MIPLLEMGGGRLNRVGMLAVHRPLTAGGRSSNAGSAASVLGGQAQQSVASEHDGRQRTNLVGSRGLEIRQQLEQLQSRPAVVEKQSTDETPITGNPKADALTLTMENLPKDDSCDDVRAVLVVKHRDAVLEATKMKPLGGLRSGSWKSCQTTSRGRGHHQNCRGGEMLQMKRTS